MAKKQAFCWWCHTSIKMPESFDEKKHKPICSIGCKNAEMLFNLHFSDEEINRRSHYRHLTEGNDDEGKKASH